ncbi:hypothetical protein L210DRAFT_3632265 [Boletus edulis BED1]|uniref:Uncharacterized protein n=1 Tax=Boletus edulis BED1 TaxID=1328754 RepID=A0AAD4BNA2_BOLED|nr:hypothetical protein L210DRAFT_3632265 [Boletus edulis BED1]
MDEESSQLSCLCSVGEGMIANRNVAWIANVGYFVYHRYIRGRELLHGARRKLQLLPVNTDGSQRQVQTPTINFMAFTHTMGKNELARPQGVGATFAARNQCLIGEDVAGGDKGMENTDLMDPADELDLKQSSDKNDACFTEFMSVLFIVTAPSNSKPKRSPLDQMRSMPNKRNMDIPQR